MTTEKYTELLARGRDAGLLLMRGGIGVFYFYVHGLPKMTAGAPMWEKLGGAMGNLGIAFAPVFWGFMSASAEFAGGALLLLGLLTRPAAAVMAFNMLVAGVMHLTLGQGVETASHAFENMFVFLGLIFTGAGKYSLDQLLFKGKL